MPYGNNHTCLSCIIKKIQQNRAIIEFPRYKKRLSVPKMFIHSELNDNILIDQKEIEIKIETWFLKKNRIIPIKK